MIGLDFTGLHFLKKSPIRNIFTATSVLATYLLGIALITIYYRLYRCKSADKTRAVVVWSLLGLLIPISAYLVTMIKPNPSPSNWRRQQLTRLFQWFYMVLILGITFYVLMARFDLAFDCEFQMQPTIVSAPTAFLKGEAYRRGFGKHMRSFAIWSAILYGGILGITLPVTLLKNFSRSTH